MIVYNYKHLVSFKILAFKKYNLEKQCNIKKDCFTVADILKNN
jgi:hypothetical protein